MSETGHGVFNREDACMNMLPALTLHIKHFNIVVVRWYAKVKEEKSRRQHTDAIQL